MGYFNGENQCLIYQNFTFSVLQYFFEGRITSDINLNCLPRTFNLSNVVEHTEVIKVA